MHLDAGYHPRMTRELLDILGYRHQIAAKCTPAPIQAGSPDLMPTPWSAEYGRPSASHAAQRNGTATVTWTPASARSMLRSRS